VTQSPAYPYWHHYLLSSAVALVFDARQARALVDELHAVLRDAPTECPRVDELAHRLTFDADYLVGDVGSTAVHAAAQAAYSEVLQYANRFEEREDYRPLEGLAQRVQHAAVTAAVAAMREADSKEGDTR
jgi:hypothetical protein